MRDSSGRLLMRATTRVARSNICMLCTLPPSRLSLMHGGRLK